MPLSFLLSSVPKIGFALALDWAPDVRRRIGREVERRFV